MDSPKGFLLKVEQDYQNQQEKLSEILGGLLDHLNNISLLERLWAAHDDAWKETAEAITTRIQYKLDEDALLDEIDARKADLAFVHGRLGDVRKGLRACKEEGQ
jgi:hypothetical protein